MDYTVYINQLTSVLADYTNLLTKSKYEDLSDLPESERQTFVTRVRSVVSRITGSNSTYSLEIENIVKKFPHLHVHINLVAGVASALKKDTEAGYVQGLQELIHAEVFSDFLDMSKHLLDNGYKDSAAVIAGSALESHLRNLAIKNGVPVELNGKPVKANKLNSDLVKENVYNMLDQKSIVAWLDLRNKAAHGHYDTYDKSQVEQLILQVQNFITRIPA